MSEGNANPSPQPGIQYWTINADLWDRTDLRGEIQLAMSDGLIVPVTIDPKRLAREISKQWSDSGDSVVESALFVLNRVLA